MQNRMYTITWDRMYNWPKGFHARKTSKMSKFDFKTM